MIERYPYAREAVYRAIDSERAFQDSHWCDGRKVWECRIDEFALYVSRYTARLVEVATTMDTARPKLDLFRKIAALCVVCMELHGAQRREP